MPVRLKLSNPLLGDDCYIGSVFESDQPSPDHNRKPSVGTYR